MKKIGIYVGCALAYSPLEYKNEIYSFKDKLREIPWVQMWDFCTPLVGQSQSQVSPGDIYKVDIIDGVGNALVVIGDLAYPSTGLGFELGVSIREHKTPTWMFAPEGVVVSKLLIGAPEHNPHASFDWYKKSIHECLPQIIEKLELLRR